jgi:hypothetical protein
MTEESSAFVSFFFFSFLSDFSPIVQSKSRWKEVKRDIYFWRHPSFFMIFLSPLNSVDPAAHISSLQPPPPELKVLPMNPITYVHSDGIHAKKVAAAAIGTTIIVHIPPTF